MPAPTPSMMPADAAEKSEEKAKQTDYYAELTDEERAAEGLPPRETAKADPAPGDKPEPKPEVEAEPEGGEEDEDAAERLFEEIADLRKEISASLGKAEPAPKKKEEDYLLEAALDHNDPVVRGLAERLQAAEKRLGDTESEMRGERIGRQLAKDEADFDAVQSSYAIGGKAMTDAQIEAVEDYVLKNPEVGSRLSIEQITRVVFPDAVKVGPKSPPAKGPGTRANGEGSPVATIVDEGSAGGAPAGPWKPRPNESVESAVQEAGRRLFGVKR